MVENEKFKYLEKKKVALKQKLTLKKLNKKYKKIL